MQFMGLVELIFHEARVPKSGVHSPHVSHDLRASRISINIFPMSPLWKNLGKCIGDISQMWVTHFPKTGVLVSLRGMLGCPTRAKIPHQD